MQNLLKSGNSNNGQGNNAENVNSTLAQLGIDPDKLQSPHIESVIYDNQTGAISVALNFTNPTNKPLEISSFSLDVADANGTHLFTIQSEQPITIGSGQTESITLTANASNDQAKATMASLVNSNQQIDANDLQFSNLNADIDGIIIHMDNPNGFLGNS